MRIGIIPENLLERVALATGLAPVGLGESWFPFLLARTIMAGTRLGVFEALADGPADTAAIAARIGGDPRATEKLLNALVGARFLSFAAGRYALTRKARGLTGPGSGRDKVLMQFLEWDWIAKAEDYVRTGTPLEVHAHLGEEEWGIYQRGMRSGIDMMAAEVARRLRLPAGARRMLDIGGSHGFYSVSLCRRHPELRSEILDLPQAVKHAAPVLAREGMGDRVVHRAGNALTSDLGTGWHLIFMSALVHHFSAEQNRELMRRCAAALAPGGVFAILDAIRIDPGTEVSQIGGLLDLFFGLTSQSGSWSGAEMASWQRDAGLQPRNLMRLRMVRDIGIQAAVRPA
jgi:hypothetical protein